MFIEELAFIKCGNCDNYFYIHDIAGFNDPQFCPYCGIEFREIENEQDL